MRLEQGPKGRIEIVESVARVAAPSLRRVPNFRLTVINRMVGRQSGDPPAHVVIERIVGGSHVRPFGFSSSRGHYIGAKHRTFSLDRHECTVVVPAQITLEHFDHVD